MTPSLLLRSSGGSVVLPILDPADDPVIIASMEFLAFERTVLKLGALEIDPNRSARIVERLDAEPEGCPQSPLHCDANQCAS